MFQKLHLPSAILYGIVAAVAFAVPMTYFIATAQYEKTWWLFVGNFLFMFVIIVYMLMFTRRKHEHPNTSLLLAAGHLVTGIGVIASCILAFIVLLMFGPITGGENTVLENSPATTEGGKTDGLIMFVYLDAIIGNIAAGSAAAIFLAYTTKRDQTKEDVVSQVKVSR